MGPPRQRARRRAVADPETIIGQSDDVVAEILLGSLELTHLMNSALTHAGAGDVTSNSDVIVLSTLRLDGPRRPRDLVAATKLTSGGVTNLVDRLVSAGFVRRTRFADGDGRAVAIELTADGVAVIDRIWPANDDDPNDALFFFLMFAPTAGALLARFAGPGVIVWGRPNLWILAGLAPTAAALAAYLIGAAVGLDTEDPEVLAAALSVAAFSIASASLSAVGEEIGWRGFLWPLLRGRFDFLRTAAIVGVVWWLYHLPIILLGWYGSVGGLPAFTVAIAGVALFVGVAATLWHLRTVREPTRRRPSPA